MYYVLQVGNKSALLLFEILNKVGLRPIESALNQSHIDLQAPENRQMLTQCLFNVGPASQRVAQHWVYVSCYLPAYHAMWYQKEMSMLETMFSNIFTRNNIN